MTRGLATSSSRTKDSFYEMKKQQRSQSQQQPQQQQQQQQQQQRQQQQNKSDTKSKSKTNEVAEEGGAEQTQTVDENAVIVEVTEVTFEHLVLLSPVPVLLEFYLPTEPVSQEMSRKLEQAVLKVKPGIRLARVNAQTEAGLVSAFKLKTVPTVIAFYGGRPLHAFANVPNDRELTSLINKLLKIGGSENVAIMVEEANALLEQGKLNEAAAIFRDIAQNQQLKAEAVGIAGLARVALKEGNLELAQELVNNIKKQYPTDVNNPEVVKAISSVELAAQSKNVAPIKELQEKVAQNPNDLEAHYNLAVGYLSLGQQENAINELLEIIKRDKYWADNKAKEMLTKIFDSLGSDHEVTKKARRRLSNLWF
jgi:putative thioredoxin